jgi:hypothetical protein
MFSRSQGLQSRSVADNLLVDNKWFIQNQAFTGATPFSDKSAHEALLVTIRGERPPRPIHPDLTEDLWTFIQRCWDQNAHLRPHALRISCYL